MWVLYAWRSSVAEYIVSRATFKVCLLPVIVVSVLAAQLLRLEMIAILFGVRRLLCLLPAKLVSGMLQLLQPFLFSVFGPGGLVLPGGGKWDPHGATIWCCLEHLLDHLTLPGGLMDLFRQQQWLLLEDGPGSSGELKCGFGVCACLCGLVVVCRIF